MAEQTNVPIAPPPPPPPAASVPPPPPAAAESHPPQLTPLPPEPAPTVDVSDKLLLIPIDLLDEIPGQQMRISRDESKFQETKASIAQGGQSDPIKVMQSGNRFLIVYGYGRVRAIRELGIPRVRAELFHGNAHEAMLTAMSENLNREDLNPIEIANGIREAIKRGASEPEVALRLGKVVNGQPDLTWVDKHLSLLKLSTEMRTEVANGIMSASVGLALSKMAEDSRKAVFEEMKVATEAEKAATIPLPPARGGKPKKPRKASGKKTAGKLAAAKAKVTGAKNDKFVGARVARNLYKSIQELDITFIPTEENAVRAELLHVVDYLLGKRKDRPLQLDAPV